MIYLALILAFLPGFAWLVFYLREDPHPEPKRLVVITFLSGAAFALFALAGQLFLKKMGLVGDPLELALQPVSLWVFIGAVFVFALLEELFKFAAAYVVVRNNPEFDEPIDAMIYMMVAALGFATLENLGVVLPIGGAPVVLSLVFETLALRFVGATLLHALTSSVVGYYWALDIREFYRRRLLVWGILLAAVLHAAFNYLIIVYGNLVYSLVFVMVVGLFVLGDFEKLKAKIV